MTDNKETETDAHNEKINKSSIKILIIDKGFGNSIEKIKHLKYKFGVENVEKVIVAEPSDKSNYQQSVNILIKKILVFRPTVIIASSRGGYYAASLLNLKRNDNIDVVEYMCKHCSFLLLSAMDTQKCSITNKPILLYHAANDGINNINKVKEDCRSYPLSKLIIAQSDTHSLESLKGNNNTKINELVLESIEWFKCAQRKENKEKLFAKVNKKQQRKVKNRFDLLSQIQNKKSKTKKWSKKKDKFNKHNTQETDVCNEEV